MKRSRSELERRVVELEQELADLKAKRSRATTKAWTEERRKLQSERTKEFHKRMTPEQRSDWGRRASAGLSSEQRSQNAKKNWASVKPEQRQERVRRMREVQIETRLRSRAFEFLDDEITYEHLRKAEAAQALKLERAMYQSGSSWVRSGVRTKLFEGESEDPFVRLDHRAWLFRALMRLTENERLTLISYVFEGNTYAETAEKIPGPEGGHTGQNASRVVDHAIRKLQMMWRVRSERWSAARSLLLLHEAIGRRH